MGYTHYWKIMGGIDRKQWELAIRQCQRIVRRYNAAVKRIDDKHPDRLSGYSAHCRVALYGGIKVNGTGEYGHEDFTLPELPPKSDENDFCKTARKPYDVVVTAILATMKYYLGPKFVVSSDGRIPDWTKGCLLASRALRMTIPNPMVEEIVEPLQAAVRKFTVA